MCDSDGYWRRIVLCHCLVGPVGSGLLSGRSMRSAVFDSIAKEVLEDVKQLRPISDDCPLRFEFALECNFIRLGDAPSIGDHDSRSTGSGSVSVVPA